jgi:type II secretory ATPase GspE/PulE/Tfp pilus assembly ATPase PilB-like protein
VESLSDVERELLCNRNPPEGLTLWEGRRCEHCRFTGFRGRTVISEVLPVTPQIRRLVQERQSAERIKEVACQEGMRTLRESSLAAVRAGRTVVAEALRVTQEDF